MSTSVTLNGTSYTIPALADASWGTNVANYLIAISTAVLQKSGGTFTLTAEIDFGATYGLKAAYLKSKTANIAAAGAVRLAKTDTVRFRNNANGADLALGIDGTDRLTFNSVVLATAGVASIVNADISASAAIAYSKLALTGAILNADVSASAAIAYSKLALTGSIVNADVSASAAIAYSKLALTGAILNADLAGSIAYSKLSLSGSIATADLAAAMLVPITKGGTGETTANAALNALLPSQASASGKVLSSDGTTTSWASALTSTLTSTNIFVGNVSNVATSVAMTGDVTISNAGVTAIASGVIVNADVSASAAIVSTKLDLDPTNMSNAAATTLGRKQYLWDVAYNGSITPSLSGTNFTATRGVFIPYKMQDGTWHLRANIKGSLSAAATSSSVALNGVVFKNASRQAILAYSQTGGAGKAMTTAYAIPNDNNMYWASGANMDDPIYSFDVELESKPTWAY